MVEFATRKGDDGHGELAEFGVIDGRVGTKGAAEF